VEEKFELNERLRWVDILLKRWSIGRVRIISKRFHKGEFLSFI
jgi:hypothetical protein